MTKIIGIVNSTYKEERMVKVYDAINQKGIKVQIKAHKIPILKMSLNNGGHLGKILIILIIRIS